MSNRKWMPGTTRLQLDYNVTIQENEFRINRLSGFLALLTLIGAAIGYLLDYYNIFILDSALLLNVLLLMLPFLLFSFFVGAVFCIKRSWVKYALMIDECVIVAILFCFLTMHTVLLLVLPMLKACLYYNQQLSKVTFIVSSFAMLIAHLLCARFTIATTDTLAEDLYSAMVYGFVPRYLEYLILSAVALILTKNSSDLIRHTYQIADNNKRLVDEMRQTHFEIIKSLATIQENKSRETGEHIMRVFEYMKILAEGFGYDQNDVYDIALSSMLHDIGKLGVDERILSKPARLTDDEFTAVKKHVEIGKDLLVNSPDPVLKMAAIIAEQHHERWDGHGYLGLHDEQINRLSRMMSVVDVFDALTSRRCYKEPWSLEDAYQEILRGRGTQFDPEVVDLFAERFDRFKDVCRRMNPDCTN